MNGFRVEQGDQSRIARARRRAGFTLIEVLIVIAIVLALGALVGVAVLQRQDVAKADLGRAQLTQIQNALDLFYVDFGRYPNDEEGIEVLWNREVLDPDADEAKWVGYLRDPLPRDIWGNEWGYRGEDPEYGDRYDLWSNGPDGEEGTDDDITSWSSDEDDGFGAGFGSDLPRPPGRP